MCYLNNNSIFTSPIGSDSCTDEWYCLGCAWNELANDIYVDVVEKQVYS